MSARKTASASSAAITRGFRTAAAPATMWSTWCCAWSMGKLCTLNIGCAPADAPAGGLHFTDGAFLDETAFTAGFPYLKTPVAGSPQL